MSLQKSPPNSNFPFAPLEDIENSSEQSSGKILFSGQNTSNSTARWEHVGKIIYLGISFCILYIALTVSSLVSEIYDQLGYTSLGQISSFAFYAALACTALIAPVIMKNWSDKKAICIGSLGYLLPLVAGVMTVLCKEDSSYAWCKEKSYITQLNVGTNIINGISAAILWIAVYRYIAKCSNDNNIGKYMGLFSALVNGSDILGSLTAAWVVKAFGQYNFFVFSFGLAVVSILMLFLAPQAPKPISPDPDSQDTLKERTLKIVKLCFDERMRVLVPFLLYAGIMTAAVSGFEYRIILSTIPNKSEEVQNSITALVFTVQGVFTILLAYITGELADKYQIRKVMNWFLASCFIALGLSLYCYAKSSLALTYVMASVWGFSFAGVDTMTGIVIIKDFNGTTEANAVLQLLSNIGTMIGNALLINLTNINLFLYVMLGILAVTQAVSLFYKSNKEENKQKN